MTILPMKGSDISRRLSSGLGLAAGADERQLRAGFPRHVAGFQSPVALNINVRIARITDEIMSCRFGSELSTLNWILTLVKRYMGTHQLHNWLWSKQSRIY